MKKNLLFILITLLAWSGNMLAQERTVEIVKGGQVVFSSPAKDVDYFTVVNRLPTPANLSATASDKSITITWRAVEGATSYNIHRSAEGVKYTQIGTSETNKFTDNSPLSGENYYKVVAIGENGAISQEGQMSNPIRFGELQSGPYLGILGFNSNLITKQMGFLSADTKDNFISFVDGLDNDDNNTGMIYAVNNAIDLLKSMEYPSDIIKASIITFTDGIDNRSTLLMGKDSRDECLNFVKDRLGNETVSGVSITSYGIGLESSGATSDVLQNSLTPVSTERVTVLKDITSVQEEFRIIAEQLYESSNVQTLKTNIPGGYDNLCKIRFTLDFPESTTSGSMNPEKCNSSEIYIEGIFHRDRLDNGTYKIYITDIICKGLSFNHSDAINATEIEVNGTTRYEFTFDGVTTDNKEIINRNNILVWTYTPFVFDEESRPNEETDVIVKRSTAAIVLVLDCTTSLGEEIFKGLKKSANTFIQTLVKGSSGTTASANGHEYVDLGLPSGTCWATCNVGASTPSGYGDYYAWGETTTKTEYTTSNCTWLNRSRHTLNTSGVIDNSFNLVKEYDVASTKWGGDWRMPTDEEMQELIDYCSWRWFTQDGVSGNLVTGPNRNSIFLPASGLKTSQTNKKGTEGYYWAATASNESGNNGYAAWTLSFSSSGGEVYNNGYRYCGCSVRPVIK